MWDENIISCFPIELKDFDIEGCKLEGFGGILKDISFLRVEFELKGIFTVKFYLKLQV